MSGDSSSSLSDRFSIEGPLGHGGMGIVYRAFDRARGIPVALKTMRDVKPDAIVRFKREFRALADVSHPNLATLYELLFADGQWFFTMELLDGIDFLSYVRGQPFATASASPTASIATVTGAPPIAALPTVTRTINSSVYPAVTAEVAERAEAPPVDLERLRAVLPQLVDGVSALHASGHLHRDIKPSNVLVTRDGRCVLLDFGIITEIAGAGAGRLLGTPAYMAPEQVTGERPPEPASDWYSVGVMLYEALAGRRPFHGATDQVLQAKRTQTPIPPRLWRSDVPPDLDELVEDLLQRDPAHRPRAAEIRARIHAPARPDAPSHGEGLLIGRQRQLQALRDAYATSSQERVCVLVHGQPGMGKTAVVEEFLAAAVAGGDTVVLAGRCYEQESVPYKAVDSLVDNLGAFLAHEPEALVHAVIPDAVDALATTFPVLLEVPAIAAAYAAGPSASGSDPLETRKRAFAALRDLIARLAARRRLILFIDDLHWGDADSTPLIGELLDDRSSPLMFLGTYRVKEARTSAMLQALLSQPGRDERVRHVAVARLTMQDARALAEALLARVGATTEAAERIARESGGDPYFIHELVEYTVARARDPQAAPDAAAVTLEEAIHERLAALPPDARRVHELVCVAGRPTTWNVLRLGAELQAHDAAIVALLQSVRLVRSVRGGAMVEPFHDRVREITVARLDAERRIDRHARLAGAIEACHPDDHEALAAHHSAAGHRDEGRSHAIGAAEQAERALAFGRAAAFYQLALEQSADAAERAQLLYVLANALRNAGRGAEAAEAYLAAAGTGDALLRTQCRTSAAEQLLISGRIDSGIAVLGDLLRDIGEPLPESRRRALLSILWHRARIRLHGIRKVDTKVVAPELLVRGEIYRTASRGLAMVDNFRAFDFQSRGLLLALRIGEPARIVRELVLEAVFVANAGVERRERAEALLARAAEIASRCDAPDLQAWNTFGGGMLAYWVGQFRAGSDQLLEAKRLFAGHAGHWWEMTTSAQFGGALCLRHLGAFRELRALYDEHVNDAKARDDLYSQTAFHRWCTIVHLAADRVGQARSSIDQTSWPRSRDGEHNTQTWGELHAQSEIALYVGEVDEFLARADADFAALLASPIGRAQIARAVALGLYARLLLAARDPQTRSRRHARARAIARRLDRERVGYAELFASLIFAALTDDAEARAAHLRRAVDRAAAHGMGAYQAVAERQLGRLVGGAEGDALLARARAWMRAEEVVSDERMVALIAPGLDQASIS